MAASVLVFRGLIALQPTSLLRPCATGSPWLIITLEPSSRTHSSSLHFSLESPAEVMQRRAGPNFVAEYTADAVLGVVRLLSGGRPRPPPRAPCSRTQYALPVAALEMWWAPRRTVAVHRYVDRRRGRGPLPVHLPPRSHRGVCEI